MILKAAIVVGVIAASVGAVVLVGGEPDLSTNEQKYADTVMADDTMDLDPKNVVTGGMRTCDQVETLKRLGIDRVDKIIVTALLVDVNLDPALKYLCPADAEVVATWRAQFTQ